MRQIPNRRYITCNYPEFPEAIKQPSAIESKAVDAAGDLAFALAYPREDSYWAAQALISLGSDITSTAIVTLFGNLDSKCLRNEKPDEIN